MAKNINIQTINEETMEALSAYYHAVVTGKNTRKNLKAEVTKAEETIQTIKNRRQAMVDGGATWDEAISANSLLEANAALATAEENYKDGCRDLRIAMSKATKLVPDSLYEGYTNRKTDRAAYVKALSEFFAEMGLVGTERGVEKLGDGIADWLVGGKKATGKKAEAGHLLADWTKATFRDMVIRAFIEYAVFEKGCFDKDDEGNLSLHVYEEKKEEEAA